MPIPSFRSYQEFASQCLYSCILEKHDSTSKCICGMKKWMILWFHEDWHRMMYLMIWWLALSAMSRHIYTNRGINKFISWITEHEHRTIPRKNKNINEFGKNICMIFSSRGGRRKLLNHCPSMLCRSAPWAESHTSVPLNTCTRSTPSHFQIYHEKSLWNAQLLLTIFINLSFIFWNCFPSKWAELLLHFKLSI